MGQIYGYSDFRSFIPLTIFATFYMINHVYTMSLKLIAQHLINSKYITKYLTEHTSANFTNSFETRRFSQVG